MRHLVLIILLFATLVGKAQTAIELYAKGNRLKTDKKYDEALVAFREATQLDPGHKDAWYQLGWCQNDVKDYTGALISLRKARELTPDKANVYFELGWAFDKLGKVDSASSSFTKCLSINPTHSTAYKQLGMLAYNKNEYTTAINFFERYEQNAKAAITDYLYWYRKGFCHNALKNYEAAKMSLYNSLMYKQDYINTYLEIGFAFSRLKLNDSAIAYFKKAMVIDPKSHIPYNGIGEVYRDNIKNMTEAMNWYRKTLDVKPGERKAHFGMGYCLNTEGKYNDAITHLKKAIESEATYTAAFVELGYSYYKTGNYTLALENLNKAMKLNPSNENSRYYATLLYVDQRNKTMAQKMVDELKSLNSKHVTTLQEKVNKL
jgi:tetratricopeptide (TPR) repeat protein